MKKQLSKKELWGLELACSLNALEGLDNPRINQYMKDLLEDGLTTEEIINHLNTSIRNNKTEFLKRFIF